MDSNISPSQATTSPSDALNTNSAKQRKRGNRGRPLKSLSSTDNPERRAQVRRAQETYRIRKEAESKRLEGRAKALEDCIEQISSVFLDFSSRLIEDGITQQSPATGINLLHATSKVLQIARHATQLSDHPEDLFRRPPAADHSKTAAGEENARAYPPSTGVTADDTSYMSARTFGSGWFDFEPSCFSKASSIHGADTKFPDSPFALNLIRTNISVAYYALLDNSPFSADLVTQMFRYAFLYHSREEILCNLRWFLGPGIGFQRFLGRAVFGFERLMSLQHLNKSTRDCRAKLLHPLVDAQAMLDVRRESPTESFMNAGDVEAFLLSKGAWINQDTIQIEMERRGISSGLPTCSFEPENEHRQSQRTDVVRSLLTSEVGNQNLVTKHHSICDAVTSDSLPGNVGDTSFPKGPSSRKSREAPRDVMYLNVPDFFDVLVRNSVCLGTGPGYPKLAVEEALKSAMIQALGQ